MISSTRRAARRAAIAVLIAVAFGLVTGSAASAQSWQTVVNRGPIFPGVPLLLTDGSVMVQREFSSDWWKLTPDIHGDYVRGTWKQIASLPAGYAPTYFASAVLADGRVFVMGGEYNFGVLTWTNKGAIYDPGLDVWTPLAAPPGWFLIGDAQCAVLPDGRLVLADPFNAATAILDPVSLTWTPVGVGKVDRHDEEGWTLLPDGTILTVDAIAAPHAERFIPSLGTWISAGNTPASLTDPLTQEIGPAVLRPDGTVFAIGAAGNTSIYTRGAALSDPGAWAAGPDFPVCVGSNCFGQQLGIWDGPAVLLPSGNVLTAASPKFTQPTQFFEFDGTGLNPVPFAPFSQFFPSFAVKFLLLPSGQVLYTNQREVDVEIYTPAGGPLDSWRPTITHAPADVDPGQTFFVSGMQFNGLSQGSAYGDDVTNATNYPIARITNVATGHVFYGRTSIHSTMGVATGPASVFTNVTVPATIETGPSTLEIVANGIASFPVPISVGGGNATPEIRSMRPDLDNSSGFIPGFLLRVNGLKFQPGDTVTWTIAESQSSLTTTVVSGNELVAVLPDALAAAAGTVFVQIARADGTVSNVVNFTLPIVQGLVSSFGNGNVSDAGAPGFNLAVNGARFTSGDVVDWTLGGVTTHLPTTFVSAGQIVAAISPALLLEPGIASITVTRGIGLVSNPVPFYIFAPPPTLDAIGPNPVSAGTPSFTLVLSGTWFDPTSAAKWQPVPGAAAIPLATTYVSRTTLTALVPASLVASAGAADVWVDTADTDPTATVTFVITPPLNLTSISPGTATAETPATIVLNGANFIDGAQAVLNGMPIETIFRSPTQMIVNIAALPAGSSTVFVVNPGGAASTARTLKLENPVPRILSLSPGALPAIGATFTLTINGTNFVTSSVARLNGAALPTTYVSPTQLEATISSTLFASTSAEGKDGFKITIQNPAPGGGGSNGLSLTAR